MDLADPCTHVVGKPEGSAAGGVVLQAHQLGLSGRKSDENTMKYDEN